MIEKWKRESLEEPNVRTKITLRLCELISGSAAEAAAWARIQDVICNYQEVQPYKPFSIDNPPNYRRILLPRKDFGPVRSFLRCSEQASMLIADEEPRGWKLSDQLQLNPLETNPESVGQGFGWFAMAVAKKYELAIFSKDRQRQIILVINGQTLDYLLERIAPGCLTAELLSLVFEKHLLKRWKQLSQRSESLRIEANSDDALNTLLQYRWYLDEL